jgi:CTP:molybdopterin cytidylyltransferase MocA
MASTSALHAGETTTICAAILLAAGAGTRFKGTNHKLLAKIDNSDVSGPVTVFQHALNHVREARIGPVIIVTGAVDDLISPGMSSEELDGIVICHNNRWAEGQSTSVHAGIDAAKDLGCNRVVVGLADQPFISPEAWSLVAAGPGPITVATYNGQRRNPVGLDAAIWHLLPTEGDEGARTLLRVRPDLVCEVSCPGSPADIDTEEDLRRWQNN